MDDILKIIKTNSDFLNCTFDADSFVNNFEEKISDVTI